MGAPAGRVHELSREWVRLGHEVTVLTAFPHHPNGIKRPEDERVLERREVVDGIRLLRTYVYAAPNQGTVRRMISYASFMLSAMLLGSFRLSKPDVVVATSPQLLCAVAGYYLARLFGVPYVFEVRDLWPESILAVNAMRENVIVRGLKSLARFLYNRCEHIVTVGEGYRRSIEALYGIRREKISVVPNGIDPALFVPSTPDSAFRRELGWEGRFVLLYMGTHGMAHALDKVLDAAAKLRNDPRLLFAFVGEGAEKEALKRKASEEKLTNVQFIDGQPKARVPLFYSACDLGIVTLRATSLFQEVLPSKIFEYLAMGKPILLGVGGEARRLVEAAGAGEYILPESVEAMASAIARLSMEQTQLAQMGERGRSYVLRHYDRRVLAGQYLTLLTEIIHRQTVVSAM